MLLQHLVTKEEEGKAVRDLIRIRFALSATHLRRIKRLEDGITLDGIRVTVADRAKAGQLLACRADDAGQSRVAPCDLPLEILYEDDYFSVINKPAGLPTHPSSFAPDEPSVAGAYLYRSQSALFHPVNRLDTGTSGIMVVAANGYSHQRLMTLLHTPDFCREYLAVCEGHFETKEGSVSAPIGRKEGSVVEREVRPDGREALTLYRVVRETERRSLVHLTPVTGRTHQLRVHMAHLGHPLTGDFLYGTEDRSLISRPPLHSHRLSLRHPITDQALHWEAPLPEDIQRLLV